ncbi:hypothetical protein [Pseudochelatococcus contaminans]|uniref:Uncharacterized protein n=1 Tax=Pseudochelatococcus contaminans TaxID=1538103 RepID=A0A7W5Z4S5_9HYPH|nr:hypothetical protein [Pseudochelatococcus contaminans]MBB3809717.1 hypothetical protein [Pseudochelatococcus contaminans]
MGHRTLGTPASSPPGSAALPASDYDLVEVWNDVVDTRHLLWSVIIGAVISVGTFLIAERILASVVDTPAIAKAYAMLAGVLGCIVSGVVSALLFPPKRVVIESTNDDAWRDQIMRDLAENPNTTMSERDLDPAVIREMEELGLRKLFASYGDGGANAPAQRKE